MRYHHKVIGGRLVLRSLIQPAGGVYHARIRDSVTGRIYLRTTRERDRARAERVAVAIAESLLAEVQGGAGRVKTCRFADAFAEWLAELDIADSTRREYRSCGNVYERHFRGLVGSIGRDDVKAFVAARRRAGRSPRTIGKQLVYLRSFLRWCLDEGYTSEDPTLRVKVPSGHSREGIALTPEEARELLEAARPIARIVRDERRGEWEQTFGAPYLTLFLLIALHTGLRKRNVLNLRWSQIDLKRRRIEVPASEMKMRRRHIVPVHAELASALQMAMKTVGSVTAYVLGRERKDIRRAFLGALKRSGLPHDLRIHDLRHTASTWMQMRLPYLMAERLLGRRVKAVANTYYHPSHDDCLAAVDSMPWIANEQSKEDVRRSKLA